MLGGFRLFFLMKILNLGTPYCTFPYTRIGIFCAFLAMLYDGTRWSGILTFCGFVLFLSQSLRVSESRESRESQSLGNVIFNILESHVFQKYSKCWVLSLSLSL